VDHDNESLSSLDEEDDEEESDEMSEKDDGNTKQETQRFFEIVPVGDRKYQRKVYSNVFVGSGT